MTLIDGLPAHVVQMLRSNHVLEYATVSAQGYPIDTPVLAFPGKGLRSFDLATGLAYPAKAERARRNPRVGLLIEGGPDEPVISIGGIAAVRDADLQANVERYLAEASHALPGDPDWALAREAVWYWTRMLVEIAPARIAWWDNPAAMGSAPHTWSAPEGSAFPPSDPAPPGKPSEPAQWDRPPWRELAPQAVARGAPGHFSAIDAEGFPRPVRARSMELIREGFRFELPGGWPWAPGGKGCLTFFGIETFLGEVAVSGGKVDLRVERALPIFPMTRDPGELWRPTPHTRDRLMERLAHETRRRGQPIPTIAAERPEPTEGHRLRMARRAAQAAANS